MKNKWVSWAALLLVLAELFLILLSWLLSAMMTEGVRSLLSSEGMRWFVGRFVDEMQTPQLVWLLLLAMGWGTLRGCGLLSHRPSTYRERVAVRMAIVLLIIYIGVLCLLVLIPHAVLLSADGSFWPSAFSRGLVPACVFGLVLVSVTYGSLSGGFRGLYDIVDSFSQGISQWAPIIVLYVLVVQFYASLRFVFF